MISRVGEGEQVLEIPTVVDRITQQAIQQVVSLLFENEFLEFNYDYRPKRSAQQAVEQARRYGKRKTTACVDIG
jgi:retron-type reverse transcriptase